MISLLPAAGADARRRASPAWAIGLLMAALPFCPTPADAHGVIGKRFFPATLAIEDPLVSDELSLPTVSSVRTNASGDEPASRETSIAVEFAKRITPDFGLSVGAERVRIAPRGAPPVKGWGNTEIGLKYTFYRNEAREAVLSAGLEWEVGGTGSTSIGAERFSTFTPTVFFGKGLGDLPDRHEMLKPLAVTGSLGIAIPRRSSTTITAVDPETGEVATEVERHPHVLQLGLALQYSLPYLQSSVKDVGLAAPFDRMVPLVELVLQKPLDRVDDRRVTGTVNPGVLWSGRSMQVGIEAVVPINRRSGHGVGVLAQLHFFLDDLFPGGMGRPLFGGSR